VSVSVRAATVADHETVRLLFTEYVTAPHSESQFHEYLAQQDFIREIAELPGLYAPPLGALLLAEHGALAVGCVALKPLEPPEICEMKRLYVRPQARGLGAGHALVAAVIDAGRNAGYRSMRLDCMPSMHDAQRLYRTFGFSEIAAYNANPVAGSLFFERDLTR
jgi:ribosomal protein S18 acetylase RimI-like enzyme